MADLKLFGTLFQPVSLCVSLSSLSLLSLSFSLPERKEKERKKEKEYGVTETESKRGKERQRDTERADQVIDLLKLPPAPFFLSAIGARSDVKNSAK